MGEGRAERDQSRCFDLPAIEELVSSRDRTSAARDGSSIVPPWFDPKGRVCRVTKGKAGSTVLRYTTNSKKSGRRSIAPQQSKQTSQH